MDKTLRRGSFEMTAAMLISGTIGWFVLVSGQPVLDVVFWRCVFGAGTLLRGIRLPAPGHSDPHYIPASSGQRDGDCR